jgi:hypothetical protein
MNALISAARCGGGLALGGGELLRLQSEHSRLSARVWCGGVFEVISRTLLRGKGCGTRKGPHGGVGRWSRLLLGSGDLGGKAVAALPQSQITPRRWGRARGSGTRARNACCGLRIVIRDGTYREIYAGGGVNSPHTWESPAHPIFRPFYRDIHIRKQGKLLYVAKSR